MVKSASGGGTRPKKSFGCTFVVVPFILVLAGVAFLSAGKQLAPDANSAAQVFRSDPSCTANLNVTPPLGACTVVDATVLSAEMRVTGYGGKTRPETPYAYVRDARGRTSDVELDSDSGGVFVYSVSSGARARVQYFRGNVVRVTSGTTSAESVDAPDVDAATVGELPWVGIVAILVAVLMVLARIVVVRRSAA
jgi:hypothetical protein